MTRSLHLKTAGDLLRLLHDGAITSEAVVRDCIARIKDSEEVIQAWQYLDAEQALTQARAADARRQNGKPLGPLHGIPIGLKDIVDTADMPTTYGSPIYAGNRPDRDATVTAKLREAGAVIMGKTVSTEFAFLTPSKTTNPHNGAHTPGGSSSGSAAAVAAGHVPLAIGTQTAGSVIRPAAFCGVYGCKPSQGMISRSGVLQTAKSLDQIGGFARTLDDLALLIDALTGYDAADEATYARPKPNLGDGCRATLPVEPALLWLNLPFDDRLADDARAGYAELRDALGDHVEFIDLPETMGNLIDHQRVIHHYEIRRHLAHEFAQSPDKLSDGMRDTLEGADAITEDDYADSMQAMQSGKSFFAELFNDYDAILTPPAAGEAPKGLETTGDPVFCAIWTLCGLPCVTLPLLEGGSGLPLGVQLVGGIEEDDRLCRTAKWMLSFLSEV